LVERSTSLGGSDGSFLTTGGAPFDHGLHVLDRDRSRVTTDLFTNAVDGAVHAVELRRGIVLRGHVLPYTPPVEALPPELRSLIPHDVLTDDVGDDLPSRERLAPCYGRGFADLIYDEVLPSFPSEARHLDFGVDEARLLVNIYPWFFPRAARLEVSSDESRAYHDLLRTGTPQTVLCPTGRPFGAFAEAFASKLDPERVEVAAGADDLHVEVRPGTHTIEWVRAAGRRFRAPHYLWAGGWSQLCALLGLPCQHAATDRVLLGSFVLDRTARSEHHELLVGDPSLLVNRVHLPGLFRGTGEALLQVELAVPVADERYGANAEWWRQRWVADLTRLGLLDARHRVVEFDFRAITTHFNGFGAEGEPLRDADPALVRADSNVVPLAPSMANLNLNRWVPRVIEQVSALIAGSGADPRSRRHG
jgi:hypothetical protein